MNIIQFFTHTAQFTKSFNSEEKALFYSMVEKLIESKGILNYSDIPNSEDIAKIISKTYELFFVDGDFLRCPKIERAFLIQEKISEGGKKGAMIRKAKSPPLTPPYPPLGDRHEIYSCKHLMQNHQNVECIDNTHNIKLFSKEEEIKYKQNLKSQQIFLLEFEQINKIEVDFQEFWLFYPRKVAKKSASIAFKKTVEKGFKAEFLIQKANEYRAFVENKKLEERFILHASTWLNGERFNDQLNFEDKKDGFDEYISEIGRAKKFTRYTIVT
jgi:hypothetical protein